ncbi:MAG: M18 family aminopeptidase [Muribaculaceae bacterium]|nr:M18 family aminopeptidase [Muribaculaceae bacterium]
MNKINDLCNFLDNSPVNFWAVESTRTLLEKNGFTQLEMRDQWSLTKGDRRYVVTNGSAIFAFIVGSDAPANAGFNMIAAHSDSPGFRLKPGCEMLCEGNIVKLNTEVYGGPILYTWFDRPLSLAGRIILRSDNPLRPISKLVKIQQPLLVIPHLAIHFNRAVNEGNNLSKQKDMLPVIALSSKSHRNLIRNLVAEYTNEKADDIIDYDLSLYNVSPATVTGINNEMICSGRLDDLSMVHAGLSALIDAAATSSRHTRVLAVFDNEETGSGTKQGAASPVLQHILRRITYALGGDETAYMRAVASSFMISADNAHGWHPNYSEKYDPTNHPVLGGGPCIKVNANCKYMTDADSAAVFAAICQKAEVPVQYFVNHSDVAGGSTLGNILTSQIPLRGVDMGAPLWAMHSACETASVSDHLNTIKAFTAFYEL